MSTILDISAVLIELGLHESVTEKQRAVIVQALNTAEGIVRRHIRYDPVLGTRIEYYPQADYARDAGGVVWEASDVSAYTRRTNQGEGDALFVRHLPIRSITHLYIDYDGRAGTKAGAFGASTEKTEGSDFWPNYDSIDSDGNKVCRDGILTSHGLWPLQAGSVKIEYIAGYTADELRGTDTKIDASPIAQAVLIEATRRSRRSLSRQFSSKIGFAAGPLASESLGDYSYSVGAADKGMDYGGMTLSGESLEMLRDFINYGYELAG